MRKRRDRSGRPAPDPAALLERLHSPDEEARIRALHEVCPCKAGFEPYEQFRGVVRRLQKDPSPRVRAVALHVEQDACRMEEKAATVERAEEQGWRYGDANCLDNYRRRSATRYWLPL